MVEGKLLNDFADKIESSSFLISNSPAHIQTR